MTERRTKGRKLLIASIGVAAVSYVACGGDTNDTTDGGGSAGGATAGGAGSGGGVNTGGSGNTGGSVNTGGGNTGGGNIGGQIAVGNLMPYPVDAGPDTSDNTKDATTDAPVFRDVLVGNLLIPPPDAKDDGK